MAAPIKRGSSSTPSPGSWLPKLRGLAGESDARAAADAAQRKAEGQSERSIILRPNDVNGKYDFNRILQTTLGGGGQYYTITSDHLAAFRRNIATVQSRYTGGIRARQVIEYSRPIDRERANKQIRTAIPISSMGGRVRFLTNAGPDSDLTHHHVTVDFLSYVSAVTGGNRTPKQAAAWLRLEPLKIECDCGRWRYWYRFIASIGKYGAGREESGYPKIRNPSLHGVACKHILRVMAEIDSSMTVRSYLERIITKARDKDKAAVQVQMTQKEAQKLADKPASRVRDVQAALRRRLKDRERAAAKRAAMKQAKPAGKPATATRTLPNGKTWEGMSPAERRQVETTAALFGLSVPEMLDKLGAT